MLTRPLAAILGLSLAAPAALVGHAVPQQPAPASALQEPAPALTLHAQSRIVLADIVATNRHGQPVHGLTADDFKVFDNGQEQRIASFEEHDGATSAYTAPETSGGTVSNEFQHLPPVLNVLLLDTTNLELADQMYLRIQLTKFVDKLAAGQPLAVFARHGDYTVLLQPFTADRAKVQAAIERAVPRMPLGGAEYRSDSDTLRQIGAYLSQVPGRKNILWFSGGSTAYLLYGLTALTAQSASGPTPNSASAAASAPSGNFQAPGVGESEDKLREVYDELEAARIAIYPIDARGLTTGGDVAMGPQQSQMVETAEATGGHAYFNSNGLAAAAEQIVATDSSSYMLTYSPRGFRYNGKWHNIRIEARRADLHLSYRRGYFADQPHAPAHTGAKPKALLAADGTAVAAPDLHSAPLLFKANVHPASGSTAKEFVPLRPASAPARGTTAFAIDYSLSTEALSTAVIDGAPKATLLFTVLALDGNGDRVAQALDRVRFELAPNSAPKRLQVEQQIDLPRGGDFLALAVWDPVSGRLGTLQIPVTVRAEH